MKFCYIDESGTGDEPFAVMVGIIVDAQRMSLTKQNWKSLLQVLSQVVQRPITEIHTRDFYAGNGPWRGIDGVQRAEIISEIFTWLEDRKHSIVFSAVDKGKYFSEFPNEPFASDIPNIWSFLALHLTLSLQKVYQNESKNKGHTVLIFDNEEQAAKKFIALSNNPPEWTNEYYKKAQKQEPLDQIIDSPYFADSQTVGLIQVADFVSYFLRRYIELKHHSSPPKYPDEEKNVDRWVTTVFSRAVSKSAIYPSRGRCECADLFWRYAPDCVKMTS
jgi:uncharacterized protein (DUF1778 family)